MPVKRPSKSAAAKKAAKKAAPKKAARQKPAPKSAARVPVRELARPDTGATPKRPAGGDAAKARALLAEEFDRALALKEKLAAEASIGGREKGRAMNNAQEKLRTVIASLEGANRFAIKMGLIDPAQSRALYAQAMERGLYEGWKR